MIELNKIYCEDCRETMKRMEDNSIDSIVTDPPYELGFMGKHWDSLGIAYDVDLWKECLRVLKPGGYLLAFGGTRTSHRMVCAIEDAGFEIRDSILWLYGSGFPKSMDISKQIDKEAGVERTKKTGIKPGHKEFANRGNMSSVQSLKGTLGGEGGFARPWMDDPEQVEKYHTSFAPETEAAKEYEGWGTALKPAHEPICVARKPIAEKTVAQNVLKYGTGGINIDGCRINTAKGAGVWGSSNKNCKPTFNDSQTLHEFRSEQHELGRFPANIILDEFTAGELDKQAPDAGAFAKVKSGMSGKSKGIYGDYAEKGDDGDTFYDDKGGASRFFYIAKADKGERNAGLYQFEAKPSGVKNASGRGFSESDPYREIKSQNTHPTVKPIKLIQYLQRLVTPKGGLTYDPFGGSGTSALSAINEGFRWVLSEMVAEHCDIANKRIYHQGGLFL